MRSRKKKKLKKFKFFINKKLKLLRYSKRRLKRKRNGTSPKKTKIKTPKVFGNTFLSHLIKKGFYHEVYVSKGKCTIVIPSVFSFSENTNETIKTLKMLVYAGTQININTIEFDHSKCVELGICASTIMDVLLMEIKKYRLNNQIFKKSFNIKGKLNSKGKVKDILEVSGIINHLGFNVPVRQGFEKLDLISCGRPGYVSSQVVSYISKCLNSQNRQLNRDGKQILGEFVGEVITNCQIHGGENSKWYILGHYFSDKNNNFGECCLTIFNFGQSIYESLQNTTPMIAKVLNQASKRHRRYFIKGKWNQESLWTVYALQDGISRCRDKKKDPDRGSGTIKLIEHFTDIGSKLEDTPPVMSITSGHINILFSDETRLETKQYGKYTRKVIAFNEENNLSLPSNNKNVKLLDNYFPGTVLSMKFYIAPDYIMDANGGM